MGGEHQSVSFDPIMNLPRIGKTYSRKFEFVSGEEEQQQLGASMQMDLVISNLCPNLGIGSVELISRHNPPEH